MKPKRTGINKIADTLAKDSSGKRRCDAVQMRDILEDIRRHVHKTYGVDFYDVLQDQSNYMIISDARGISWVGFRIYEKLPRR